MNGQAEARSRWGSGAPPLLPLFIWHLDRLILFSDLFLVCLAGNEEKGFIVSASTSLGWTMGSGLEIRKERGPRGRFPFVASKRRESTCRQLRGPLFPTVFTTQEHVLILLQKAVPDSCILPSPPLLTLQQSWGKGIVHSARRNV